MYNVGSQEVKNLIRTKGANTSRHIMFHMVLDKRDTLEALYWNTELNWPLMNEVYEKLKE